MAATIDAEKAHTSAVDHIATRTEDISSEENARRTPEDAALDRSTLLRLDLVLVPLMVMLYFLAWLDRANIGNARVVCAALAWARPPS
jgi:hypothetical protein